MKTVKNLFWKTKGCTFYNLTFENQLKIAIENVEIILGDALFHKKLFDHFEKEEGSFTKFLNFRRYNTLLTPVDPCFVRTRTISTPDAIDVMVKR